MLGSPLFASGHWPAGRKLRSVIGRWRRRRPEPRSPVDLGPWLRRLAGIQDTAQRQIVLRLPPGCFAATPMMDALSDAASAQSGFSGIEWLIDPVTHRRLHAAATRWANRDSRTDDVLDRVTRSVAMRPSGDARVLAVASADLEIPPDALCVDIELD